MAIHEHIRRMVKRAGTRRNGATVVSHCGGSVDGRFATGKGIFHVELEGVPGSFLLGESRLYLWFYYRHYGPPAIIYRKHRDCGTTRHAKPTMSNVGLLMRYGASCCWVIFSGQVLRRGHLNICLSSMKKLAMHLSKSAWM